MKRVYAGVATAVVLLAGAAVIAPNFVDWNSYKTLAQEQVKKATDLDLALAGDMDFAILPFPHFVAEQGVITVPEGRQDQPLAQFEKLDVNVSLLPLLRGAVEVSRVTLVKPYINLERSADGKLNFVTPKIEAMMAGQESSDTPRPETTQAFSLQKLSIKDGVFSYSDAGGKPIKVEDLDIDLEAQTMQGPFSGEGSFVYNESLIQFDATADNYNPETKALTTNAKLTLQPGDVEVHYAGLVQLDENYVLQGETKIKAENFAKALSSQDIGFAAGLNAPLDVSGILTLDPEKAEYRDFAMDLGGDKFTGSLVTMMNPLRFNLDVKSDKAFSIQKFIPGAVAAQKGGIDLHLEGGAEDVAITNSSISLDGNVFKVSGGYKAGVKDKRGLLTVKVTGEAVDYDALTGKAGQGQKTDIKQFAKSFSIPVDLDFDLSADRLKIQGTDLSSVAARGSLRTNSLKLSEISVRNFAKSDVSVSGTVDDIQALSSIAMDISLDTKDARALATAFKVNPESIPEKLNQAKVQGRFTGSAASMNMLANIDVSGGELIAEGKVQEPFTAPALQGLALQVKHPNMAEALQVWAGAQRQDPNLRKPMDFYAKVSQEGKIYQLSDIKGNLAGTSVQGTAKIDISGAKPMLQGDLVLGKIVFDSKVVQDGAQAKAGAERWSREAINTDMLHGFNADIKARAASLTYGPWPLQNPDMKMSLVNGVLDSALNAGLFEGSVALHMNVKSVAQERQPLHISGDAKVQNVSTGALIRALAGREIIRTSGSVTLDLDAVASGVSPAALVHDLGGKGTVKGADVVLENVDVSGFARALSSESKPADTLQGVWKSSAIGGSTDFDTLDGNFTIAEGIVNINKLDLDGVKTAIVTTGKLDLPNWTMATKHKIIMKGQTEIPPFEMAFQGPMDNPGQTFGQGVLQDYLNRKVERKVQQFLNKKLGLPVPEAAAPQAAPQPEAQVSPSGGAEVAPAPSAGSAQPVQEAAPQEAVPQQVPQLQEPEEINPEEAMKGLLRGLLAQ